MKRRATIFHALIAGAVMTVVMSGCSSALISLTPRLPEGHAKLGRVSGRACGMLVPYAGAEQFLPIRVPSRIDRAYANAVASAPGATGLVDVTIQDDWMWPVVGLYICTNISGEAVR